MRYTITVIFMMVSLISKGQKSEMGFNYIYSIPRGPMQYTISDAHGFTMDYFFLPKEKRYSFGIEVNLNTYGHDKTRQTYTFQDGSTAPMDIVVNNNFYSIMLTGRYFLSDKNIRPFISGKAGYSFFTTDLYIYDPDDADHCEPVDSDILSNDGTLLASVGGGLRLELLPKKNPGAFFLDLSANYSLGGKVEYMNVDAGNMNHAAHIAHTSDVYAQFINTQTQVVHEHHVGNVYSSSIKVLDFRLGVHFRIGRQ